VNKKILYGYQIQDGELNAHPQEAEGVKRIFSLYLAGVAQQRIADILNTGGLQYSAESPAWSRPRVIQALRNSRYMGEKGYPALIDAETFRAAQTMRSERMRTWGDHPALYLVRKLRCGHCGYSLRRLAQSQWKETLRFHCDGGGMSVTIPRCGPAGGGGAAGGGVHASGRLSGLCPLRGHRPADQRHQSGTGEAGTPGGGDLPDYAEYLRPVRLLPYTDDSMGDGWHLRRRAC
jgi:ribosomal protein L37E